MSCIVLYEICTFLNIIDINYLGQANKELNKKVNIKYILENVFYKKYDKVLKEVLEADEYSNFNYQKYDTYKESCKNCYFIMEAKRDQIM